MRFWRNREQFWRGASARVAAITLAAACLIVSLIAAARQPAVIHAAPAAVNWPAVGLQLVASGFSNPVDLVDPRDGTNRLFVVERNGLIRIIQNGQPIDEPFLDIESKVDDHLCPECGLLGLAFPPDFAEKGYFFINYTNDTNLVDADPGDDDNNNDQKTGDTVIARVRVSGNPNRADADSEEPILIINQPAGNHNGGHMLFGPDGYLYIGMGDGGGGGDEFHNAQDPKSLLGKILRIAVGESGTYTIPADNPFQNTPDFRDEIWAWGVRNPWRFGFDRDSGDFYLADVGQGNTEEIDYIAAADIHNGGWNFGWPIYEGDHCYPPDGPQDCSDDNLTGPVITYGHDLGCSITGGDVYRSPLPQHAPVYLFADYCAGTLFAMQRDGEAWVQRLLADYDFRITSFGKDHNDVIYVVSYDGDIYRLVEFTNHQYIPGIRKAAPAANQ